MSPSQVYAGDSQGGVGVHRTLNLVRIADALEHPHHAEVTGLLHDEVRR
jgi:hypothetical protein